MAVGTRPAGRRRLPGFDAILLTQMQTDGSWSKPAIAPFSGAHPDFDPLFAPDGRLWFSSRRPAPGKSGGPSGIWVIPAKGKAPQHIPLSAESDYYSSLTADGTIYFNTRDLERGNMDIHRAVADGEDYAIENLGKAVNSGATEADPFVSPDERYMIFRSYRRSGLGGADLYISFRINGAWQKPHNLGAPINSAGKEMCPLVTADGKLFIFASDRLATSYHQRPYRDLADVWKKYDSVDNGNLNLYVVSTDFIQALRQKHHPQQ